MAITCPEILLFGTLRLVTNLLRISFLHTLGKLMFQGFVEHGKFR